MKRSETRKNKIRESTGRVVTRAGRVRINIDKAQRVNTGLTRINVLLVVGTEIVRNITRMQSGLGLFLTLSLGTMWVEVYVTVLW